MTWSITMFKTEHTGSGALGVTIEEPWDAGSFSSPAEVAAAVGGVNCGEVGVMAAFVPRLSEQISTPHYFSAFIML
jgi:hypothetical protein